MVDTRPISTSVGRMENSVKLMRLEMPRWPRSTSDVERGQRGISSLISFTLFSILPTLVEIGLVSTILATRYDWSFVAITAGALLLYIGFTVGITEWRTHFRRQMN